MISVYRKYFKELEAIKERVKAMEAEAEKLKVLQSEVEKQMHMGDAGKEGYIPSIVSILLKFYLFFYSLKLLKF